MGSAFAKLVVIFLIAIFLAGTAVGQVVPNPVLVLVGNEYLQTGGKQFTRYKYTVFNLASFPNTLFAAAPSLPPCGANKNSSRSWIDIFDQRGKRLNGFCAITNGEGLNGIWFSLETGEIPPSWIYIEITDRQTNTKYKSNLAETTL